MEVLGFSVCGVGLGCCKALATLQGALRATTSARAKDGVDHKAKANGSQVSTEI